MALYETPSRIWRRIEDEREPSSLPSLPGFEHSVVPDTETDQTTTDDDNELLPVHSTPAATSAHSATVRLQSSTSSTVRFATSIASRSASLKSSVSRSFGRALQQSFDVSPVTSLPHDSEENTEPEDPPQRSTNSVPEAYLPPESDEAEDMSLVDALESVSRASSPLSPEPPPQEPTPKKKGLPYDYSVSLRSEPQPSPTDKFRNVALRRPVTRTRTPSLSRSTSSSTSSPPNSTPRSSPSILLPRHPESPLGTHIPLPRSASGSPAVAPLPSVVLQPPDEDLSQTSDEYQFTSLHGQEEQLETEPEKASNTDDGLMSDREPTFSSASSDPSYPMDRTIQAARSPIAPSTAVSSPAPSTTFTPTPAIVPRPCARFNIPPPPQELDTEENIMVDSEPLTPHTRRRSFLLSVINSTARPRMRFVTTPHPHRRLSALPVMNESIEDAQGTPGSALHKAFAGITPRPRRGRISHPLAQTYIPDGDVSETGDVDNHNLIPNDDASERGSVISTTSSQDLVTHVRANTSYDPALGLGERGKMGRFDAQRLNSYLHGLNHHLQEENIELAARLQKYEEVKEGPRLSIDGVGRGRRLSAVSALGDVEEESGGEGWAEERLELETRVQKMMEDLEQVTVERDQVAKELDMERNERARDKERWRERMVEVERGVSEIVGELEKRVEEAEEKHAAAVEETSKVKREAERVRDHLEVERDLALERAAKADSALESGKELGGALKEANAKISALSSDLQIATANINELEEESAVLHHKVGGLEKELKEERLSNKLAEEDFQCQLSELGTEVMRATARVSELQRELIERDAELDRLDEELQIKSDELTELQRCTARSDKETAEELRSLKVYIGELEEGTEKRVKDLQGRLARAQDRVDQYEVEEEQATNRMERLETEAERAAELARQMEEALEAAEEKMKSDEERMVDLRSKLVALEREQERHRDLASANPPSDHEVEALEAELDEANKEIARLSALLQQSPARRAIDKAKDTRIEALEREKEDLLERVRTLKSTNVEMATPHKVINASGISPVHRHVLSMTLKAPKTPGAPLKDLSWLNATTGGDLSASPLLAEIARLQTELDHANDSIDQKLDELQEVGLDVVELTKNLEDARSNSVSLENENARLQRREERRCRRLEKLRCQQCFTKIDPSRLQRAYEAEESTLSFDMSGGDLLGNPPAPLIKSSEELRVELQNVNAQLDTMKKQWQGEKRQLLGEKAVLHDAANRMNIEVRNAKQEVKKALEAKRESRRSRADTQGEAEKAKVVIADLEAELQAERTRLRKMSTEQECLQREIGEVARQLQRTEMDMDDVKYQLQKAKQDNHELENEFRENANAEQNARLLEAKVRENMTAIEQLRQERSLLARDHKDLQQRYAKASERAHKLRNEYSTSQKSHESRRQQLDMCLTEIEDLKHALSNQADQLQRTEQEKNRIVTEKTDIARTIAALEAELKRVRKDAEMFGHDLKALRAEKEKSQQKQKEEVAKAGRAKKQAQTQIHLLNDQLEHQNAKTKRLLQHVCSTDDAQLDELRAQHKQECKGLIVQIHYLKAKFTRESALRDDLGYQKQYLLVLLSSFEASDRRILACISRIGYPKPLPPALAKRRRTFKSAAWCIVFIRRARFASNAWREACANKQDIIDALQEARRRRVIQHR